MCKVPSSGTSKTRLCPPLTLDEAAELSRCFISDLSQSVAEVSEDLGLSGVAVYTPAAARPEIAALLPGGFELLAQRGDDLGERALGATQDLLRSGYDAACLVSSDSPTMPRRILTALASALRAPGDLVVLSPAIDGGYSLIGLKQPHAPVFRNIDWSTPKVLAQTLSHAAGAGLPVSLLPPWYDVDDEASLQLLIEDLFGGAIGLRRPEDPPAAAPRTRRYLADLLATAPRPGLSLPTHPRPS